MLTFPSNWNLAQLPNLLFNDGVTKNELPTPPAKIFTTAVVQKDALGRVSSELTKASGKGHLPNALANVWLPHSSLETWGSYSQHLHLSLTELCLPELQTACATGHAHYPSGNSCEPGLPGTQTPFKTPLRHAALVFLAAVTTSISAISGMHPASFRMAAAQGGRTSPPGWDQLPQGTSSWGTRQRQPVPNCPDLLPSTSRFFCQVP